MSSFPWPIRPLEPARGDRLAQSLDLHPAAGAVLAARGFDADSARAFLEPRLEYLHDPMAMAGMEQAARRLLAAARQGEPILVYGDYDVDGICGTLLLKGALTALGARVSHYLPHRLGDGYGLHAQVLARAAAQGVRVVVTVDTGITAVEAAQGAAGLGLDLIITDHHALPAQLPEAIIVHPLLNDGYPYPHLAGGGVAFKLVQALAQLAGEASSFWEAGLDLAALATIADMVPLTGENRVLTYFGMERMRRRPRPGLAALLRRARIQARTLSAWEVAFQLAPRLNAAGRLEHADLALNLLAAHEGQGDPLAGELETVNLRRRSLQDAVERAVRDQVARAGPPTEPVLAGDPEWHRGVLGVVAGRLADQWQVPVLLAQIEDGLWQGSARSIPGFDIAAALAEAGHLLLKHGGHAQAAGFTAEAAHIPALRRALAEAFAAAREHIPRETAVADAYVDPAFIDRRLALDLARLEPWGAGNPPPLLASRLEVMEARTVGDGDAHLKLTLAPGVKAIAFGQGHRLAAVLGAGAITALHTPVMDYFNDRERLQLRIEELVLERPRVVVNTAGPTAPQPEPAAPAAMAVPPAPAAQAAPRPMAPNVSLDRSLLAGLYRLLRSLAGEAGGSFTWEGLCAALGRNAAPGRTGSATARDQAALGIQVFLELGLLQPVPGAGPDCWQLQDTGGSQVQLTDSPTFRRFAAPAPPRAAGQS
ncbi:MAG TPA: single-stranded-DNA-specific exonuclease RecJ [Sphingobacteriaceae bacterium]|nr:single-stranded-DNA-specific exonuclease RecJ [Sphingobacteriaceae bacterium]